MTNTSHITEEQAAAARNSLGGHTPEFWYDINWTEQRVYLDGVFTLEDLEAIILLKRYHIQQQG